jgi:thiol-disulfide isomerase/thioredoxin
MLAFLGTLPQIGMSDDRQEAVQKLIAEYETVEKEYFERAWPKAPTEAEKIHRYEQFPGWRYLPRFLELAESQPGDQASFRCCLWILDRTYNVGNDDKSIFEIEQRAWDLLAANHADRPEFPVLCMQATDYNGPAQERFLRRLASRDDLSHDRRGTALLTLAELLARKHRIVEYMECRPSKKTEFASFIEKRRSPDWGKDLLPANAVKFKTESIELFRAVLADYAEVPFAGSAKGYRNFKNLGEKAAQSLHALEYLTVGAEAPNIVGTDLQGRPLDLRAHRGKVVVISFWFTGCGPCVGLIPTEKRLISSYQDRPFILLGVCGDDTVETAQETAEKHGIDWPCWFDGQNGPIVRDWNVSGWPTVYVLDRTGRIVAKGLVYEDLEAKVKTLMEGEQ